MVKKFSIGQKTAVLPRNGPFAIHDQSPDRFFRPDKHDHEWFLAAENLRSGIKKGEQYVKYIYTYKQCKNDVILLMEEILHQLIW